MLKEACATRAVPAQFTCHCYLTKSIRLTRKGLQLLSSFLYCFSLLYLDRPSTGAEVGRYERFVFLFLALVCRAFRFCLWGQYFFFEYFETYRFY